MKEREPVLRPYDDSPESIRALALQRKPKRDYKKQISETGGAGWEAAVIFEEFKIALSHMMSKGELITLESLGRKVLGTASRNYIGHVSTFLRSHPEYPLSKLLSAAKVAVHDLHIKTLLLQELDGTGPSDAELASMFNTERQIEGQKQSNLHRPARSSRHPRKTLQLWRRYQN